MGRLCVRVCCSMVCTLCTCAYRCNGDEKSLDECESVSGSSLDHDRDVGVECRQPTPCSTPMVGNMITALHVSVHEHTPTFSLSMWPTVECLC